MNGEYMQITDSNIKTPRDAGRVDYGQIKIVINSLSLRACDGYLLEKSKRIRLTPAWTSSSMGQCFLQMLFIGGIIGRFREIFNDAFRKINFAVVSV